MLKALRYEILRDITASGLTSIPLAEKPVRVATIINENSFLENQYLIHNKNVFLEDFIHDWNWQDGKFRYYTRVATKADVLIVYEQATVMPAAKFDPMTGKPLSV
jgi:hypothetical protein